MKKWAVNMKAKWNKYWRKIWFKLLIIAIGVLVVVGLLYCAGLRITYAPELKNDWDSVSAYAAWAGVIVAVISAAASFLAVWFAIKVADKQNKIALFEKRHAVFDTFNSCKAFSVMVQSLEYKSEVRKVFLRSFCENLIHDNIEDFDFIMERYCSVLDTLRRSQFLFDADITLYIRNLITLLLDVVTMSIQETEDDKIDDNMKNAIKNYTKEMNDETYQNVIDRMGKDLKLK